MEPPSNSIFSVFTAQNKLFLWFWLVGWLIFGVTTFTVFTTLQLYN